MVVEEKQINDDSIILDKNYVESFKEKFKKYNMGTCFDYSWNNNRIKFI